ncbi:cell wall hydrolase [Sphingosinicella humi]|uniref:Cell wall hydrolase n=1 Tax=Allosphingosinicella humi TaxID=2068657 RepID=A0A2U2J3J5_9SPHN|nr:cell wall hydrolase [Sphingosinicella humi]PWG02916.1 cell wall hydrolase [Sphingosinicella humi]
MASIRKRRRQDRSRREWLALALLVPAASCVPETARLQSPGSMAGVSLELPPAVPVAAPSALPSRLELLPAATSIPFRAASSVDGMRALDCLAEAIYYEARSEAEEGQRAVAQVVLNRVRHPDYPKSICGVVYQGPMKTGPGCQFTFTCDGSLVHRPTGIAWARARHIAAEAIAGRIFAPVGHSTHYHTLSVYPGWAPALTRTAVIGSHIFYRRPGAIDAPSAFTQIYSGREPGPAARIRYAAAPAFVPNARDAETFTPIAPAPAPVVTATDRLPQSRVRPEYENSGRWKDAPADIH